MSAFIRSWGQAVDSLTIELPWPVAALSPNHRSKWDSIKARKTARNYAFAMASNALGPLGIAKGSWVGPIAVGIIFHPSIDRERDVDNFQASQKAALDGIALALGVDDKHFRPVSEFGAKRNPACVVVTLKAAAVSVPLKGVIS